MTSIIKDYSKLTDNQLYENVCRGWDDAITEARRRGWNILTPGLHLGIDGKYYALNQTVIARPGKTGWEYKDTHQVPK